MRRDPPSPSCLTGVLSRVSDITLGTHQRQPFTVPLSFMGSRHFVGFRSELEVTINVSYRVNSFSVLTKKESTKEVFVSSYDLLLMENPPINPSKKYLLFSRLT